ncbi:hypothetical protein ACHWQZ_G018466 [Mnemiopsis leidyi]
MNLRLVVISIISSVLLVTTTKANEDFYDYSDYSSSDEWSWDFSDYDWSPWESFDSDSWSVYGDPGSMNSDVWNYHGGSTSNSWGAGLESYESLGSWTSWENDWYASWSQDFSNSWSSWDLGDTWSPWDSDYQWLSDWSYDDYYMEEGDHANNFDWSTFDWDWSDFNSIWTDIEWQAWSDTGMYNYFTDVDFGLFPESYTTVPLFYKTPARGPTSTPPIYLDIEKYWTGDVYTDWCRDSWVGEVLQEDLQVQVEEFLASGNITLWCTFPGQVMIVSDLSNLNLNDPEELPSLFKRDLPDYCSVKVCQRHLLKRTRFNAVELVEQTLRVMNIYRRMDCMSCFCKSQKREVLDKVLAITKDHLKKTGVLGYITTEGTPDDVTTYFQELKEAVGLENVELPDRKKYTPLLDMDQAIRGPGTAVPQIKKYMDLAKGIHFYCSK